MNRNVVRKSGVYRILNCVLAGVVTTATLTFAAKTEVPLFLFSGQSNMVGMGATVTAEQQKIANNDIKIYLDAEGDKSLLKKWSAFGPGFGNTTSTFGPELYFGKVLSDSMPGKKIAFIKVARSGTWLGKATEWLPPSSNNGVNGKYYDSMMVAIDLALKKFNDAFDTSLYTPKWSGFIWLQGEFDAMGKDFQDKSSYYADKYEVNLTNLIKDIRTKTGVADLPIILPMIDIQPSWGHAAIVRAADVACKTKLKNVDTMDTKNLATDKVHYTTEGMVIIGQRCAQRWLTMKYLGTVPVIYQEKNGRSNVSALRNASENAVIYNLSGRQIVNIFSDVNNRKISSGSLIYNSKIISNVNNTISNR